VPKNSKNRHSDASTDEKSTTDAVLDESLGILVLGLRYIRDEIAKIATGKARASRRDPASRIASLTARVGSIADSVRKIEAARAKRYDSLTPAQVLAWLRQLLPEERADFLREASLLDARRSGLG